MARPRTLPDDTTLRRLLADHTMTEIAGTYRVTVQAVSDLVRKRNIPVPPGRSRPARDATHIPWVIRTEHHRTYERRMLSFYSRQQRGGVLSAKVAGQVRLFTARLDAAFDGRGGVLDYNPENGSAPFAVVPRRPGVDIGYTRTPDLTTNHTPGGTP